MPRRLALVLCAVVLAALGTVSIGSTATAECPYLPPYPPVTAAARSADEIIVGTVLENVGGRIQDFRMRIDHVLRGSAQVGTIRRVKFLYTNWPLDTTSLGDPIAPCEPIAASPGNVIALAYNALAPDGKTRYNAVSWISGRSAFGDAVETTTLAKIQAVADLPQTDTAAASVTATASRPSDLLVLVVGLLAGTLAIAWLERRGPVGTI